MTDKPVTDEGRDALIRTMTRQCQECEALVAELRAELLEAHRELSAVKAGAFEGSPFGG